MQMARLLVVVPLLVCLEAQASPPPGDAEPPQTEEERLEEARLITGRDLYLRGNERFDAGDCQGAVDAWQQVVVLMPDKQGELRVSLAHAHRCAYEEDLEPTHLSEAQSLFRAALDELGADEAGRSDIEQELAEIEAEQERLALEAARAEAAEDEAKLEKQRLEFEAKLAALELDKQKRIQTGYYAGGGVLVALGAGGLAAMSAFLVRGAQLEQEGFDIAGMSNVADGIYAEQLQRGQRMNLGALVSGIAGGAFVAAGGALLVVARLRHQRVIEPAEGRVALVPAPAG